MSEEIEIGTIKPPAHVNELLAESFLLHAADDEDEVDEAELQAYLDSLPLEELAKLAELSDDELQAIVAAVSKHSGKKHITSLPRRMVEKCVHEELADRGADAVAEQGGATVSKIEPLLDLPLGQEHIAERVA